MTQEKRVALVTGASRGIGRAIAHELGRQGRIVIGTATSKSGAEKIDADLKADPIFTYYNVWIFDIEGAS